VYVISSLVFKLGCLLHISDVTVHNKINHCHRAASLDVMKW